MASSESIGSSSFKQPPARIPKLQVYESLFRLNEDVDRLVVLLRDTEELTFAEKESLHCAIVEIEEVRCDVNADFTEKLADSERLDEGHFWKQRREIEKKWRDPDDVYFEAQRREEERKLQGLPSLLGVLPRPAVVEEPRRQEPESEKKKKKTSNSKPASRERRSATGPAHD